MPGTIVTSSPNVSLWNSKIVGDLCLNKFYIDSTTSVWIGSGASNVLGARIKITNPYGVIIKPYGSSYDIAPSLSGGMDAVVPFNIPTQAGKPQYGVYTIELQLTDADGTLYTVSKTINVCTYNKDQNPCDDRLQLIASCKNGTLTIALSEPPLFKGFYSESRTQTIVVNYPTESGETPLTSSNGSFSVQLFEGVYKVVVNVCATYNLTDSVYLRLPYSVTMEKNVKCLLDYTCIWPRIKQLWDKINEDCSQADRDKNSAIALEASLLIPTIQLANDAGEDASPYISQLETLLGCTCTCDCNGSPIVNGTPSTNMAIEGCNVVKTTIGLTDVYTIENYTYLITVDPTQSIISISAPALDGCEMSQQLSFSISAVYAAIKTQINNTTEYAYWASIIRLALSGLVTDCLDEPTTTLVQLVQSIINKACAGGSCSAVIDSSSTARSGSDVVISWTETNAFYIDIYVDDVLAGTVLSSVSSFTVPNVADGDNHTYLLVPKCSNGTSGTVGVGVFNYLGCPVISPPVVSSNSITGVTCPYDITSLLSAPPVGITVEWHTANNTSAITLVPDATEVSSGVYFAFAKDADGCYSTATQVTLICDEGTSCTAPQSLTVTEVSGDFRVTFNSAAFPPPGNSYTVKRRLASDPDVDGSYTTIGTPVYNSGLAKWVITDTTGLDNTLYVYKAISNCGDSPATTPYTTYNFANISCPSLTLTPDTDTIDYSFSNVGGQVDKYEVEIYDSTGLTLIHTDTIVPAFSSPITGTFNYLTEGVLYKIRTRVFIGSYSYTCGFYNITTDGGDGWTISYTNNVGTVPMQLFIGNNNTSPTTLIYSGNYTSDPLVGTDANLPAVNANVIFAIGGGRTIISITCNGVAGATGGTSASWSGVNGSILINVIST